MLIPLLALGFVLLIVFVYLFAQGNRKTKDEGNRKSTGQTPHHS